LRLVSLAQAACAARGLDPARHIAIVSHGKLVTFLLKRSPLSTEETDRLERVAKDLGFTTLYAPSPKQFVPAKIPAWRTGAALADYRELILAPDPAQFVAAYPLDISATTHDRPFYFHTTRLRDQFSGAFGERALLGNGLGVLVVLFAISGALVLLFIVVPLLIGGDRPGPGWGRWLLYFGALGAGFMLLEVALLQRFVLLLGHPVYSLTVTLFSLLLGTGLGSLLSPGVA